MNRLLVKLRDARPSIVVLGWLCVVSLHAVYFIESNLANFPTNAEWYARSQSFQLLNFGVARLPIWLLLLGVYFVVHRSNEERGK